MNSLEGIGWWEEDELPDLAEIDELLPATPALFHRRCLHIIYLNSAAIAALGLNDKHFIPDENVHVVRDEHGKATGILKEGFNMVRKSALKQASLQTQKRYIQNGLKQCANAGLTQVHACEGTSSIFYIFNCFDQGSKSLDRII